MSLRHFSSENWFMAQGQGPSGVTQKPFTPWQQLALQLLSLPSSPGFQMDAPSCCRAPRPPTGAEAGPKSLLCVLIDLRCAGLNSRLCRNWWFSYLFILCSSLTSYFILQVGDVCIWLVSLDNIFTKLFWLLRY